MIRQLLNWLITMFDQLLENMNMTEPTPIRLSNSVNDKNIAAKGLWRRRDGADPYYVEIIDQNDTHWTVREPSGQTHQMDPNQFPLEYEKAF